MVNHPVLLVEAAKAVPTIGTVFLHILVAKTEAHVANNDIVSLYGTWIVGDADAIAWGCLSGNRGV
jgi:hypothetical protein